MMMVYMINEGAPVEDFLKQLGPFKGTVYDPNALEEASVGTIGRKTMLDKLLDQDEGAAKKMKKRTTAGMIFMPEGVEPQ